MRHYLGFDKLDGRIAAILFFIAIALGFLTPWWTFAVFIAAFSAVRAWIKIKAGADAMPSKREQFAPSVIFALAWIVVALARDLSEGGRISSRLAMIFQLPSAALIYVILFAMIFILSSLAGLSGRLWIRILAEGKGED